MMKMTNINKNNYLPKKQEPPRIDISSCLQEQTKI